jgi:predicted enzyme related to lactoylglutathione lyase
LPLLLDNDGFTVFGQSGGGTLLVVTHSEVRGPNGDPARYFVSLSTDDVDTEFGRLKGAGVRVIEAPSRQGPNLRIATLADPEGNLFSLVQSLQA